MATLSSCGIVFRFADVVRANALEDNVRLYFSTTGPPPDRDNQGQSAECERSRTSNRHPEIAEEGGT
jgi:hypothetical protein